MPWDIHPASEAERLAAYRNVHDVWSHGLPMEQHLARRLRSVQHNRAEWFVGCLEGQVVTALGAYPLRFHWRGEVVPGMAIGSVHTLAAHRGQGLAPRLIAWVEEHLRSRDGAAVSLLYSDVPPGYYARQGYVVCRSHEGWASACRQPSATNQRASLERASRREPEAPGEMRLVPLDVEHDASSMAETYAAFHGSLPVAIARPADYWQYLLRKNQADERFWLEDAGGRRQGYVCLTRQGVAWKIADYALARHDEELLDRLYQSVARLAADRAVARVGGWLPDVPAARRCFAVQPRAKEITMLKSLDRALEIDAAAVEAAAWLCEIDHV
jgi:predicted N-acetyltransferase YhbS